MLEIKFSTDVGSCLHKQCICCCCCCNIFLVVVDVVVVVMMVAVMVRIACSLYSSARGWPISKIERERINDFISLISMETFWLSIFQIIIHETIQKWMLLYWTYNKWMERVRKKTEKLFRTSWYRFQWKIPNTDQSIQWKSKLSRDNADYLCMRVSVIVNIMTYKGSEHTEKNCSMKKLIFRGFFFCIKLHRVVQC